MPFLGHNNYRWANRRDKGKHKSQSVMVRRRVRMRVRKNVSVFVCELPVAPEPVLI